MMKDEDSKIAWIKIAWIESWHLRWALPDQPDFLGVIRLTVVRFAVTFLLFFISISVFNKIQDRKPPLEYTLGTSLGLATLFSIVLALFVSFVNGDASITRVGVE